MKTVSSVLPQILFTIVNYKPF